MHTELFHLLHRKLVRSLDFSNLTHLHAFSRISARAQHSKGRKGKEPHQCRCLVVLLWCLLQPALCRKDLAVTVVHE
jgi:hypothetical protein